MAGFLGWVRHDNRAARVVEALECLRHHPTFRGEVLAGDGRCGAAVLYRPSDPPDIARVPERGVMVGVLGAVLEYASGRWHRFSARELADRYLDRGIAAVSGLDGFYQILVWDEPAATMHILDDRVGSMWVQYATIKEGVAFAPEAKALFWLLPLQPRLDFLGVVSFLNMGYPIGTSTLFEGVRLLAPAHRMTIAMRSGQLEQQRTWVQRFDANSQLSLHAAADLLFDAVLEAHRAPLSLPGERPWIALTGGYDSRVMLAVLPLLHRPLAGAYTWGSQDDLANSDPDFARKLAGAAGIDHLFLRYEASDFERNVDRWLWVSEGATDNLGYYAAGAHFLYFLNGQSPRASYIGDVVIASGNIPRSRHEAWLTVARVPMDRLSPALLRCLNVASAEEYLARQIDLVNELMEASPSSRAEDVQDFLWGQVYNFRWLFSPGFYREPMATPLRPMLLQPMYDCLAVLPPRWRAYKRLWVEMLRRKCPRYARLPRAYVPTTIAWDCVSRRGGRLAEWLAASTRPEVVCTHGCRHWLVPGGVDRVREDWFSAPTSSVRGNRLRALWAALRMHVAGTWAVAGAMRAAEGLARRCLGVHGVADQRDYRFVFRLALVARLMPTMLDGLKDRSAGGAARREVASGAQSPPPRRQAICQ